MLLGACASRIGSLYGWGDAENANIGAPIPKNKAEKRKRLRPTGPIKVSAGGGGKRKQAGSSKVLTQITAGGWHVLAMDDEVSFLRSRPRLPMAIFAISFTQGLTFVPLSRETSLVLD